MDILSEKSKTLLLQTDSSFMRTLMEQINWKNRLIGIVGGRGTGKTTLMLQHLKLHHLKGDNAIYLSLDDIYFTENKLSDFVRNFRQQGGRYLYLDEVHKYPGWAREIKNLYDFYKDLHIVFSGSSIINLLHLEVDLSRRALLYELPGLSFREYLAFNGLLYEKPLSLADILSHHAEIAMDLIQKFKPIKHFSGYLSQGYYPFFKEETASYHIRLEQIVRLVVYTELQFIDGFDAHNARKIFQLLYILSTNVPFKPNITKLSEKTNMHRNTLVQYLYYLEKARLIHRLWVKGKSISSLQKPDKIYLHNTNLAYALAPENTNKGTLRETFFINQLSAQHTVSLPAVSDFLVNDKYTFEVGGREKDMAQIKNIKNAFIAADDLEIGTGNKIPLWMFGFLY